MKKWTGILLILLLLTGCTRIEEQTTVGPRVVTGISVRFHSDRLNLERQYSDGEKMRDLLTYLRCLKIYAPVEPDVEIPGSNRSQIVLSFSDGSTKTYEQQGDQFLRQDGGTWHYANQEQAREFPLLLTMLEGDEIS